MHGYTDYTKMMAPAVPFFITPSDSANLDYGARGIAFSTTGAIHGMFFDGKDEREITIPTGVLAAGVIHPLRITKIFATGTTITNIIGFR